MTLSTHVLDAALGRPARNVAVAVDRWAGDRWVRLASGVTDADGRLRPVDDGGGEVELSEGVHRIEFATGAYFEATGQKGFFPQVSITFEVTEPSAHHHVPLLLSPFAYSTYRGS
jgi:5-hydroxyisourate hydrolase